MIRLDPLLAADVRANACPLDGARASRKTTRSRYRKIWSTTALVAVWIAATGAALATDYVGQIVGSDPATTLLGGDTVTITNSPIAALAAEGLELGQPRTIVVLNGGITATNNFLRGTAVVRSSDGGYIDLGDGSHVIATGAYLNNNSFGGAGMYALGDGGALLPSTIVGRNIVIDSSSSWIAYGAMAHNGGALDLTGTTIINIAGGADGAVALPVLNGNTTIENARITMRGFNGVSGYWAQAAGVQQGGSFTATGHFEASINALSGAVARSVGANTSMDFNTITATIHTTHGQARGILAQGGTITVRGKAELSATSNFNAVGIYAFDAANVSMLGPSTITVSGPQTWGIVAEGGSSVTLDRATISATATGTATGIYISGAQGGSASSVSLSNSTLNTDYFGIQAASGSNVIQFTNTSMNNNDGRAVNVAGVGTTLALNMNKSHIAGFTAVSASTSLNMEMRNGSTWRVTGDSVVTGLLNQASTIQFSAPTGDVTRAAAYKTMSVANYSGDNGLIVMNTHLGADGSPTDLVHVTGDTAGTTNLRVINAGGGGAPTVEGIRVIQVDGISAGDFTLVSDYSLQGQPAVIAGAYAYTLHKNGVSQPTDGNWYLRSALAPTPVPPTALYQPGSPLYETMPKVALGLLGLPTLQQRFSNRSPLPGLAQAVNEPSAGHGIWGRIDGGFSHSTAGFSTTDARVDQHTWRAETGLDFVGWQGAAGKLMGGVSVHYGQAMADVFSPWGDGRNQTTGYGLGATATWQGANGFYADAQGRVAWLTTDLTSHVVGLKIGDGVGGTGHALGLEVGQRFALSNQLSIVPQAQLTWAGVHYDDFVDPYGAAVRSDRGQSLQGRLGLALQHEQSWADADGNSHQATSYATVNLYHEFLDGLSVDVSSISLRSEEAQTWAGIGVGSTYNLNGDGLSLYGEVLAASDITGRSDSYRFDGKIGLRARW